MRRRKAYYSIIQYMPDALRMEAINVGVVMYVVAGRKTAVDWYIDAHRLRRFFPNVEVDRVYEAAFSVVDRIEIESEEWKTVTDLWKFAAERANAICLTDPRPVSLRDDDEVELKRLFDELVKEPT